MKWLWIWTCKCKDCGGVMHCPVEGKGDRMSCCTYCGSKNINHRKFWAPRTRLTQAADVA